MTQAYYRKWRPQTWDQVVGQEHIITTLRNAVVADRVAHAYLFAGPRGTGKTSTARLLAKAVNCLTEQPTDRPCNQCEHCEGVNQGRFLDLIEIDAASNTGEPAAIETALRRTSGPVTALPIFMRTPPSVNLVISFA